MGTSTQELVGSSRGRGKVCTYVSWQGKLKLHLSTCRVGQGDAKYGLVVGLRK